MSDQILLPPGRIVWGSLYTPNDKDMEGRPLLDKTGKPRVEYVFGIAIPKVPGQHWASSAWGAPIWAIGHKQTPNAQALGANFSWKVQDGDSAEIRPPATVALKDKVGCAGHWIVKLSGGYAPKVYKLDQSGKPVLWLDDNAVQPGDYIEAFVSITPNGNTTKPGVYINHSMVCFVGYGERISTGPDASSVGFGAAARPAGASAAPLSVLAPSAPTPSVPSATPAPVAPPAATGGAPTPPAASASTDVPPPPHTAILTPPVRAMSAKANGASYEKLLEAGWTDELLTAHGMFA
jgi:hypothetical protein